MQRNADFYCEMLRKELHNSWRCWCKDTHHAPCTTCTLTKCATVHCTQSALGYPGGFVYLAPPCRFWTIGCQQPVCCQMWCMSVWRPPPPGQVSRGLRFLVSLEHLIYKQRRRIIGNSDGNMSDSMISGLSPHLNMMWFRRIFLAWSSNVAQLTFF